MQKASLRWLFYLRCHLGTALLGTPAHHHSFALVRATSTDEDGGCGTLCAAAGRASRQGLNPESKALQPIRIHLGCKAQWFATG